MAGSSRKGKGDAQRVKQDGDRENLDTEMRSSPGSQWFSYKPQSSSSKDVYSPLTSPAKSSKASARASTAATIDISSDSNSDDEFALLPPPPSLHRNTAIDQDDGDLDIEQAPAKRRLSTPIDVDDDDEDDPEPPPPLPKNVMFFCLEVEAPSPQILAVRKNNAKPVPPKTTVLGPFKFKSSIRFPQLLDRIAQACQTTKEDLVLPSLEWKFDRPQNSKRRPLTSEVGLELAIKSLLERRKDFSFTVFMAPPQPGKKELPWLQREDKAPLDFDYSLEELTATGSSVLSVREQIHYPIDNNPAFPGKRIFRNETGYFHLDDAKLRVWAVATAKGNADIDHCPVSTHFKKDQTLRVPNALPLAAAAVPQTPTQPAVNETVQLLLQALMGGGHAPYAFPPHPAFYAHQYPPPPPPPYGAYPPSHAHAPPPSPAAPAHPESIELPREISLDEFCTRYKISVDDRRILNEYTVYKQNLKNRL
ncbi:putative proline-rich protein [Favolaschia claudopus]|uniref:Proline-rich protein n=1 Tax=Favolaschia claudopus TaxID=2862362 RepID=A0AAV9ZGX8_9AGAR